jgi:5,6-dimethylbenzimidazole synthase
VDEFYPRPMLEIHQWAERMPLETVVFENGWREASGG